MESLQVRAPEGAEGLAKGQAKDYRDNQSNGMQGKEAARKQSKAKGKAVKVLIE